MEVRRCVGDQVASEHMTRGSPRVWKVRYGIPSQLRMADGGLRVSYHVRLRAQDEKMLGSQELRLEGESTVNSHISKSRWLQ